MLDFVVRSTVIVFGGIFRPRKRSVVVRSKVSLEEPSEPSPITNTGESIVYDCNVCKNEVHAIEPPIAKHFVVNGEPTFKLVCPICKNVKYISYEFVETDQQLLPFPKGTIIYSYDRFMCTLVDEVGNLVAEFRRHHNQSPYEIALSVMQGNKYILSNGYMDKQSHSTGNFDSEANLVSSIYCDNHKEISKGIHS